MSLNNGKHLVAEVDGTRCTVIEKGIPQQRVDFLKELLEHNGYEVKVQEDKKADEEAEQLYTIGVTDLIFNPVLDVYKRKLRSKSGHRVTPAYWLQLSDKETEAEINYWNFKPKK